MANLEPFEDKLKEMISSKNTQLCDFGGECFGFACDKYYNCKRHICTREQGNDESEASDET